jgi:pimeloyl-ACP methyl ester carboxylesterase
VLVGPVVDAARPTLRALAAALARDSVFEPPSTQAAVTFDYLRCGVRWFLREAVVMRDYSTAAAIGHIVAPLLVIRGQDDPIARAPWARRLAEAVPGSRVVTVAGHRHNVPHSDPRRTAAEILRFSEPVAATSPLRESAHHD